MYDFENNSFNGFNGEDPDKRPEDSIQPDPDTETVKEETVSFETQEETVQEAADNVKADYEETSYEIPSYEKTVYEAETEVPTRETARENRYYDSYDSGYRNSYYQEQKRYSYDTAEKPKKKNSPVPYIVAFLLIVGLGIGAFFGVKSLFKDNDTSARASLNRPSKEQAVTQEEAPTFNNAEEASKPVSLSKSDTVTTVDTTDTTPGGVVITDVSSVVEQVMPCLVAITDNLEVTQSYNPYNYFFGGRGDSQSRYETVASGSGVIIGQNENELLIVTNNHVVDNEGNYTSYSVSSKGLSVPFIDDTTADATVKGTDSDMDLAVIAVNLNDLSEETKSAIRMAVVGSSDDAKIGSGVICIGNAMGYGQSVTTGIISAKDREVTINNITRLLLQTDAAINPGNSGGGMFNSAGELIGINSAKYSDTDVEGMCFAIPISSAEDIIEELMNKEVIPEEQQGYLGINGETVPSTYVMNYGYPEGVSITRIQENSPAEAAGLQLYDIITAVNGKKITSMDELRAEVSSYAAGTTVEISIQRPEGRVFREMTINATLVSREQISISSKDNVVKA